MPLFDGNAERLRKENLKKMEDKRIALAVELEKKGIKPDRMVFCADEVGSFTALARDGARYILISAPVFGSDDDFRYWIMDKLDYESEEVHIQGTGLNGAFGFGIKGASGVKLHIHLPEGEDVLMELVSGRSSALEVVKYAKNILLSTKRRRGDANVVWDFAPLESGIYRKIKKALDEYYLA